MESKEHSKPKLAFIGTDWGANEYRKVNNKPGAISTYRLIYPMRYLEEYYDIEYFGSDFKPGDMPEIYFDAFVQNYDLIISKVIDNEKAAAMMRFFTQHHGVKLVVDIDDNIWEITPDQPGYADYYKGSRKLSIASTYVSLADAVFSSTQPLADYIKKRVKKIFNEKKEVITLQNCVDPSDYNFKKVHRNPNKIVIGWQGSTTHNADLAMVMPAITKILKTYPQVEFEFLGGITKEKVTELFSEIHQEDRKLLERIAIKAGVPAFDKFPELLSQQPWDIAIAPLEDREFNRSKSHIKWMEYAMYEIPCIASKVYPYFKPIQGTDTIRDGETGILAKPDEWFEKLSYLIENKDIRETIGKQAKEFVSNEWNIQNHVQKWKKAIDAILD